MSVRRRVIDTVSKTKIGERAVCDQRYRIVLTAAFSLLLNLSYAIYHGVLGIMGRSWWFIAICAYYIILGMTRFSAVLCERKSNSAPSIDTEYFVLSISGALLLLLSCVLAGVNYMSLQENIATQYGEITMITIATYTFGKLVMAIIRVVKHRRNRSPLLAAIRRIGYAELAVSVLTLQRSMLVSFGEMEASKVYLMNALTGTGVYLFIFVIGIFMMKEKRGKNYGEI